MNKIDIVEAILAGDIVPELNAFDAGSVVMALFVNTFPSRMVVPLVMRHLDGSERFLRVIPFAVGSSRLEAHKQASAAVDRLFDTLEMAEVSPSSPSTASQEEALQAEAVAFVARMVAQGRCIQCAHPWYDGTCYCGQGRDGDEGDDLLRRICEHPQGRKILRGLP